MRRNVVNGKVLVAYLLLWQMCCRCCCTQQSRLQDTVKLLVSTSTVYPRKVTCSWLCECNSTGSKWCSMVNGH